MSYRLQIENPIPLILLIPTSTEKVKGVNQKKYPTIEDALKILDKNKKPTNLFFGSFKTYGGTEQNVNGIYSIQDTANVETW